ncbi:esterase-like activity of phytase family protein [Cyanobium sp. Morenito 9A2]|uniref:esterase-like activity of phytase family protein n=1 Tax=Cyanobium sp. Morenito 9A2 TaxID=2823718 RepID=UPI0020CBE582|nr:esterase-like activity of phytase family protein [Cyanobium sp. Morenito 9A2]
MALPSRVAAGRPLGGFSAVSFDQATDLLWLLSDAPQGYLIALDPRALRRPSALFRDPLALVGRPYAPLPVQVDGEGLARAPGALWITSEGRRSAERPAQLLRFDPATGLLQRAVELPEPWQARPGQGLESNSGPESLTWLPAAGGAGTGDLLLAAETPLRQDPPDRVRLLRYAPSAKGAGSFTALPALALPKQPGLWGLTELLVLPDQRKLLGLWRSYLPPEGWGVLLSLYRMGDLQTAPAVDPAVAPPLQPLFSWDLIASGLASDNWEGLAVGPQAAPGAGTGVRREGPALLLVSDDNFNPRQRSLMAVLRPRRTAACPG